MTLKKDKVDDVCVVVVGRGDEGLCTGVLLIHNTTSNHVYGKQATDVYC